MVVRERYAGMRAAFGTIAARAVEHGDLAPDIDVDAVSAVLFGVVSGFAPQRTLIGDPDRETYLAGIRSRRGRPHPPGDA